jgi:3-dehydroquinate dehydratase-2
VSIVIVHGPHTSGHPLPQELQQQLEQQAGAAGCTLELRGCSDLSHFVGQVCAAASDSTEFVLLDPGDLASQVREHPEAGLVDALDQLAAPYIEVHEECGAELEHEAGFHKAPLATVIINGNIGSGYRIGLSIALRQLQEGRRRDQEPEFSSHGRRQVFAQRVAGL